MTGLEPNVCVLSVAVPCPLRRCFDYLLPEGLDAPQPGSRVLVNFNQRKVTGVVMETRGDSEFPLHKLKPLLRILDERPSLAADIVALLRWASGYYHHPIGECATFALPPALRSERVWPGPGSWLSLTDDADKLDPETLKRAPRQQALLQRLQTQGPASRAELREAGFQNSVINELQRKTLLQACDPPVPSRPSTVLAEAELHLNDQQTAALKAIRDRVSPCFLLDGITGSGKTEIYLQAISSCLARGEQALVLVPEIGLTPQTVRRFEQRFTVPVAVLHSGMTAVQRLQAWEAAENGHCGVLIGTRTAIFAALRNPGLIVVDEEHDPSFKQQDGFRFSARDLAVKRGHDLGCPVILGSATPSLESLFNAKRGRYHHLHLTQRAGSAEKPLLILEDMRSHAADSLLSPEALTQLRNTIKQGKQALVFINRRGFSPILQCQACGWLAGCHQCDTRLTVHLSQRNLRCHECGKREALPVRCPDCQQSHLSFRGPGTERVEAFLQQQFAGTTVVRIDGDSVSHSDVLREKLVAVHEGKPALLVGTQMLAKGHHFPELTLVILVDADGGLFSADYRAVERSAQILVQVSGRSGRGRDPGVVVIQTRSPEHPIFETLLKQGYGGFAEALLEERESRSLPPYSYAALLRADSTRDGAAEHFLQGLADIAGQHPACHFTGPLPAPVTRRAGRFHAMLILQSPQRSALHAALSALCDSAETLRRGDVHWSMDVDPAEYY